VWNDRDYFAEKLPEWQARASAWQEFLRQMTGDLVK